MFEMGDYGVYIWPAYALSVAALGGMTMWTVAAWRVARRKLAGLEKK